MINHMYTWPFSNLANNVGLSKTVFLECIPVLNQILSLDLDNAVRCEATCACVRNSDSVYSRSSAPHFPGKSFFSQIKNKIKRSLVIKKEEQLMLHQSLLSKWEQLHKS